MKVLFVLPEFPPHYGGGIATYYGELVPAIAAEGHEVDVLVGSGFTEDRPPREENGYSVEFLDVEQRKKAIEEYTAYESVPPLRRTLAAAWALYQQSDGGVGYDVVETTDFGLLFLPWVAFDDTPPVLVRLAASNGQVDAHEPSAGGALQGHMTRLLELQGLTYAEELQTNGRVNAQRWSKRLDRKVEYCPPPLQVNPVPSYDEETDEEASGFVAGRIQYWKGPITLCEAQSHLGTDAPHIDWAGRDTKYRQAGMSMSDYLAETYPRIWGRKVRPIGQIPPAEVNRRQHAAKFVVVPSVWDVFNFTAAEAMRAGNVVICSDGAGAADLISHGENGFVFPADDARSLAKLIKKVTRLSGGRRKSITDAARKTVQEKLDPQAIAKDRESVYRRIQDREMSRSVPSWLAEAIRPNGEFEVPSRPLAFLDKLSLWDLSRYLIRRTWRKLTSFE